MTTAELHEILDDENRKLPLKELKQVIYELKQDCFNELPNCEDSIAKTRFYQGEQNAFQIVLDLLEHLDNSKAKFYYERCKSYGIECFCDSELEEE